MEKTDGVSSNIRIKTIDIFRALTMFLMIFVNDIWSLSGIPGWLGHTLAEEDGMGFSDIIFPLFLFIVGLSIPLAIDVRFKRKETRLAIVSHILTRTIALLVNAVQTAMRVFIGRNNLHDVPVSCKPAVLNFVKR